MRHRFHCLYAYIPGFLSQQKINSSYYLAILNSEKSLKDRLKAFALTPGSKLVVPSSVPLSQNLKWRKF